MAKVNIKDYNDYQQTKATNCKTVINSIFAKWVTCKKKTTTAGQREVFELTQSQQQAAKKF